MSGLNKLDLMIYIAIIDYRLFFFFALLSLRLNFKKKLKARKVMPRAYYRFCLINLGEFLPSQELQDSLRFLYLLVR